MNIESLRKHLAIETLGWELREQGEIDPNYYIVNDETLIWECDWKPDEDTEQAMMCLYKFGAWSVRRELLGNYFVTIDSPKKAKAEGHAIDFLMAICLACAKARGWK